MEHVTMGDGTPAILHRLERAAVPPAYLRTLRPEPRSTLPEPRGAWRAVLWFGLGVVFAVGVLP